MEPNRRDFFRKLGQIGILSVLVGGSTYLLTNDRVRLNGCGENQFCESCRKFASCSREAANKQKEINSTNKIKK